MGRRTLAAVFLAVLLSASPAGAYSKGGGRSDQARGQDRAADNCHSQLLKQNRRGVRAGGGPKKPSDDVNEAPANCDHYWQEDED